MWFFLLTCCYRSEEYERSQHCKRPVSIRTKKLFEQINKYIANIWRRKNLKIKMLWIPKDKKTFRGNASMGIKIILFCYSLVIVTDSFLHCTLTYWLNPVYKQRHNEVAPNTFYFSISCSRSGLLTVSHNGKQHLPVESGKEFPVGLKISSVGKTENWPHFCPVWKWIINDESHV
jgi:hypothetical protein